MAVDPACGVSLPPDEATTSLDFEERTYYFCSEGCKEEFLSNPSHCIDTAQPPLITSGGMLTQRVPFHRERGSFELDIAVQGELNVGDQSTYQTTLADADVRKFAEASGDTNALHLNDQFAEKTRFGRRIVHGTLVAGTISAALAALPGLTIYLSQHNEFKHPVSIGETVTATCEIQEVLGDAKYDLSTDVATSERSVIEGTSRVLIDPIPDLETPQSSD